VRISFSRPSLFCKIFFAGGEAWLQRYRRVHLIVCILKKVVLLVVRLLLLRHFVPYVITFMHMCVVISAAMVRRTFDIESP
jgi:hypothetical protein